MSEKTESPTQEELPPEERPDKITKVLFSRGFITILLPILLPA